MTNKPHNIICLEAEWYYNSHEKKDRFNLNTEPLLRWLKEYHGCNVVHRNILTRADLFHYLNHFAADKKVRKYDIVYIACHGGNHALSLEGEYPYIDLRELAEIVDDFFEGKIIHFSSCKTLANEDAVNDFIRMTGARLVTGYAKNVDAMKSAIADMALFNYLMYVQRNVGIITNRERSELWKTYHSLLDELQFKAYKS